MIGHQQRYLEPAIFRPFANLIAAESTRHGGCSPSPFSSLNLGIYTDDDPANVSENRQRFFEDLGIDPKATAGGRQVHGKAVLVTEEPGQFEGYDAFVTQKRGLFMTVKMADCVPVLVYDPVQKAVGAAHAGWKGTVLGIAGEMVKTMNSAFGTKPSDCHAYIGTCIGPLDFEVGIEVADQFLDRFKKWDDKRGKFLVDLKACNAAQLTAEGIQAGQVEISPYSTVQHNEHFFSYRKEQGRTGRLLAVIGMI